MNYCYGKEVQNCILCWEVVPLSEGLLSEVPLYYALATAETAKLDHEPNTQLFFGDVTPQ